MRELLLAAIRRRILALPTTGDPGRLLGADALDEVRRLLELVGDVAGDMEVAHTVGMLYMFRWQSLSGGKDDDDMRTAVILLAQVHRVAPDRVPEPLRTYFRQNPSVVADVPKLGEDGPEQWTEQARHLLGRARRSGDPALAVEAVNLLRRALAATPPGHPDHVTGRANLGFALRTLSGATGDPEPTREAISLFRQALAAAPPGHPDHGYVLAGLAICLQSLFWLAGDVDALTEGVQAYRSAVAATPPGHPEHARRLARLGAALQALFERTGNVDTLTEAVEAGRAAVTATPPGHPDRAGHLNELGVALRLSFQVTGDLGRVTEAVEAYREAIAATPRNAPHRGRGLRELGIALMALFIRTGNADALTEAVEANRDALAVTPPGDPDRAGYLRDLGSALMILFGRTGDTGTLTEAVEVCRAATAAVPSGNLRYAPCSMLLGNALRLRFERAGDLEDLREAVRANRDALAVTPPEHINHTAYLNTLGMTLLDLAKRTKDPDAEAEALELFRRSLAATPVEHAAYTAYSANLGAALGRMFERTGDMNTLGEAVRAYRDALATTSPEHPVHGEISLALGRALWSSFERTGDPDARREAGALFTRATASTASSVSTRFNAMRGTGVLAMAAGDATTALTTLENAVALLPQFSPRRLSRADREHGLGRAAWVAAEAASAAIGAGRPDRAVELLEQARGVLLAETMGARGDLSDLHAHAPEQAAEFVRLRDELDATDPSGFDPATGGPALPPMTSPGGEAVGETREEQARWAIRHLADRRRRLADEWEELLTRIREVPGLATFLLPPRIDDLRGQAADGPVAIVNVSNFRCDVLILTSDAGQPVKLVELPGITIGDVVEQVNRFQSALALTTGSPGERLRGQQQVRAVLSWLWDEITGPVLSELGLTGPVEVGGRWPRLWWCPVGEMAFLPLHAAGHHGAAPPDTGEDDLHDTPPTVMDRVVSSYTTTLRALRYARQAHRDSPGPDAGRGKGALIVAMPETPGALVSALPGARSEAQRLTELLPGSLLLTGPAADHDGVLAALPRHRIVHLACHGLSDANNPAAGRLLLYDHETRPLTVTALARLHLARADLAYLSACGTTETSQRLADQAVHITAAFQLVGYKHVIGTLWSINDRVAVTVADEVYTHLTDGGTTEPRSERAAHALHHAIRRLRDDYPASPTLWASHIHVGI
ncbi:CHAT domain-containing protein [Streptosporangium amethystogenes subsp. fukuiense]|uniref:CHAT domain-containing protein n=1 Tax=Streptosporangium amethystogenes subsp. fukuiense TaxID=698418 RepID=A0ABW2TDR9_9ACTN